MTDIEQVRDELVNAGHDLYVAMADARLQAQTAPALTTYLERVDAIIDGLDPVVQPEKDLRWRACVHVIQTAVAAAAERLEVHAENIAGPQVEIRETVVWAEAWRVWEALQEDVRDDIVGNVVRNLLLIGTSATHLMIPNGLFDEEDR